MTWWLPDVLTLIGQIKSCLAWFWHFWKILKQQFSHYFQNKLNFTLSHLRDCISVPSSQAYLLVGVPASSYNFWRRLCSDVQQFDTFIKEIRMQKSASILILKNDLVDTNWMCLLFELNFQNEILSPIKKNEQSDA